jgi:hypothetical protein
MKKLVNLVISIILPCAYIFIYVPVGVAQSNGQESTAQPQDGLDDNLRAAILKRNGINPTEAMPQIPPPLAVSLPPPASVENLPKMALSWRCRALALANEYPLKKNSMGWTLPVTYKQGQLLLKQAIMQIGLTILSEYDDSGQFLISLPDLNKKGDIIIISQPAGETSTLFKMHIYADHPTDIKRINCLPDTMKNLLENRGLWQ